MGGSRGISRHNKNRRLKAQGNENTRAAAASWTIYGAVKQWVNTPNRIPAEGFVSVGIELVQPVLMAGLPRLPNQP